MCASAAHVLTEQLDASSCGNEAPDGVQQRRLPRAVRTDQADHLIGESVKAHVLDRDEPAEGDRETVGPKH